MNFFTTHFGHCQSQTVQPSMQNSLLNTQCKLPRLTSWRSLAPTRVRSPYLQPVQFSKPNHIRGIQGQQNGLQLGGQERHLLQYVHHREQRVGRNTSVLPRARLQSQVSAVQSTISTFDSRSSRNSALAILSSNPASWFTAARRAISFQG